MSAALARALKTRGEDPLIVKLVQTGAGPTDEGDAAHAGRLAGCPHHELARFFKAADPWTAALAEGMPAVHAEDLQLALDRMSGAIIAEGAGGVAVPLNRAQTFADVAQLAKLETILVVGLRLGCLNHALLTLSHLSAHGVSVAGAVLVDRWHETGVEYHNDVRRTLQGKVRVFGILPFEVDETRSIEEGACMFDDFLSA